MSKQVELLERANHILKMTNEGKAWREDFEEFQRRWLVTIINDIKEGA